MKKILLSLVLVGLVAGPVLAANRYWDSDQTAAGNDAGTGAGLGGTGTWDTATLNWWDSTAPANDIAWTDGNVAIFTGSPGVVTIPASQMRSATGLTFNTDGYEIAAGGTTAATRGDLSFSVTPTITVAPNVKATISARLGAIAGYTLGYNVVGGGTLKIAEPTGVTGAAFGGQNTTLGSVSVSSGSPVNVSNFGTVLEVIGGGQIGNSGTVGQYPITLNGGTYRNTDPTPTGSAFSFTTSTSRNWVIGTNGGVWDTPTASSILLNGGAPVGAGSIVGGAGTVLYKTGPGEIRMAGVTGQTNTVEKLVINEGRFTIGQATTLGRDVQLGAVPGSYLADAVTLDGINSGAILRFAGGDATTTVTTNVNRGITLGTTYGGTNTFQVGDTNAAIPAVITGPGGFIKTGGLTLTLSGANNYAGTTTVSGGILALNNTTGSGVSSGAVTVNSGGNLRILSSTGSQASGGVTLNAGAVLSGTGTLNGTLSIGSGAKVTAGIGGANAVLTVPNVDLSAGAIVESTLGNTGTSDVLKVSSPGTGLNLNGGTISLVPVGTTNPAGQTYTLIDYTGGYTGSLSSLLLNNGTGFEGTTLVDDTANHVIKAVVGTVVNDRTWVREGDYGLWNSDAPPGPNESANWAKPDNTTPATAANGVGSIARFPGISPVTSNAIGSQTITISDAAKTLGTMVLDNPNSLTFGNSNSAYRLTMQTYTGNALIDVKQGTHFITTGVTFTSPTNVNLANGTALTLTTGSVVNTGGLTVNTVGNSTYTTRQITNTGTFTKLGTGTVAITTSDWAGSGAVNINEGMMQYSNDNAAGLSNTAVVTVAAGATLDFNSSTGSGVSDTFGALAGAGSLLNHRNLTLAGANASPVVFSGTLGLSAALGGNDFMINNGTITRVFSKTGAGSQTLSGPMEPTGNFNANSTVTGGTLILNNPSGSLTTSTAALTVSSGATLGGTGTLLGPVTINSGGILSPGSGGVGTIHLQAATALTLPSGALLSFDIGTGGADQIDANASAISIATSTTTKINLVQSGTITPGTYTLIDYNTLAGTGGFAGLSLGTQPAGFTYSLTNDTANTQIKLTIASAALLGDFNSDGKVDAGDYATWRKNETANAALPNDNGLATQAARFDLWRANFGKPPGAGSGGGLGGAAVPEPSTLALVALGLFATLGSRRRGA